VVAGEAINKSEHNGLRLEASADGRLFVEKNEAAAAASCTPLRAQPVGGQVREGGSATDRSPLPAIVCSANPGLADWGSPRADHIELCCSCESVCAVGTSQIRHQSLIGQESGAGGLLLLSNFSLFASASSGSLGGGGSVQRESH